MGGGLRERGARETERHLYATFLSADGTYADGASEAAIPRAFLLAAVNSLSLSTPWSRSSMRFLTSAAPPVAIGCVEIGCVEIVVAF